MHSLETYEEMLEHRDELICKQTETIHMLRDSLSKYENIWWVKFYNFFDRRFK